MHAPYCSCRSCIADARADAIADDVYFGARAYLRGRVAAIVAECIHDAANDAAEYLGVDADAHKAELAQAARRVIEDHFRAPAKPPSPPVAASLGDEGGGTPSTARTTC